MGAFMLKPWELIGIKPSVYISGLCYSILRLEPWSTCSVGCVYCYATWYRGPHGKPKPQPAILRLFTKIAKRLSRSKLLLPFFRLATLTEPLQQQESDMLLSYRILSTALRHDVPIILNTKLPSRLLRDPWLSLIGEMADRSLILVQVSAALPDEQARLLEPNAEDPNQRLEAIRELTRHGVPTAIRVQPLIPGLERHHEHILVEALSRGARMAIGESIRLSPREAAILENLLGITTEGWEPYELHHVPGRTGLRHPPLGWRQGIHTRLSGVADGLGATYSTCKEGFTMHSIPGDCCDASLVFPWAALRPTLHEARLFHQERGRWPSIEELCEYARSLDERYVCGSILNTYPQPVARAFRVHEKRLSRILAGLARGDKSYYKLLADTH
ncbi:Radical SAM domain protein [Pyrolobus fumarii 1A]|uniref:Radical SAM domain protein n=2 Tax=Pyrolobus fumarii TaxID=54252 RepID=G0EDD3_PYRF1|nr:Radical SAM domain protein [Pyrolobus fumarii 1A]